MIQIVVKNNNNKVTEVNIKGHAMYDDFGKDIVCAGVSSILTTTVDAILLFDENAITVDKGKDFVLSIKKFDKITTTLVQNMISLFQELEETYPENIKIKEDRNND